MVSNRADRLFHTLNYTIFTVIGLAMVAPMIHLLAVSLSAAEFANAKQVYWDADRAFFYIDDRICVVPSPDAR